ncbi:MAG: hypothetical protein AAGA93_00500 [Actinomycetota bacterium]
MIGDPVDTLRSEIERRLDARPRPLLVAVDGRSGTGKSTLAAALRAVPPVVDARPLDAALPTVSVIEGDDFYAGGSGPNWDAMTAAEKVEHCIDWRRQRPILADLRAGRTASWQPFDWESPDWDAPEAKLAETTLTCRPSPVVVLEGVYSGRPELDDLVDLRVLLDVDADERRRRLVAREGEAYADAWFGRWTEAEEHYFGAVRPPTDFDLVLSLR